MIGTFWRTSWIKCGCRVFEMKALNRIGPIRPLRPIKDRIGRMGRIGPMGPKRARNYMVIVHLTSSTFFGGPERQMLGLAHHLVPAYRSIFLSFSEKGRCRGFLDEARQQGFDAWDLNQDTPHFLAAIREVEGWLQETH